MEAMNDTIDIDDEDCCDSLVSISDDSDEDPSYSAVEETRRKLSNLSVRKKSNPSVFEESDDGIVVDDGEVEEVDEKSYEEVQRIVGAGKTEKLKVEQCKVYLRKNGLRLTGNKATLIQRINEHLEISNGGGEKKYPLSSFFMNCKGDACTGDVVLFEQNVYDTYSIASRSATGPPCGTRMVTGRIVKESYGAAKQQHTFTIEVLWSKGEKPLPPLHPLLIKGRNLYRLKTMRQRWDDEEERRRMLNEKHARGSLARSRREVRIEEKEKRKGLKENRASKIEPRRNQPEPDLTSVLKPSVQPQRPVISELSRSTENQMIGPAILVKPAFKAHHIPSSTNVQAQNPGPFADHRKVTGETQPKKSPVLDMHTGPEASQRFTGNTSFNNREPNFYPRIQEVQHTRNQSHFNSGGYMDWSTRSNYKPFTGVNTNHPVSPLRRDYGVNNYHRPISSPRRDYGVNNYHRPISSPRREYGVNNYHRPISPPRREYDVDSYHRPISPPRRHYSRPMSPPRRENFVPRKPCHHYARGRCHYGETCKFSHSMRD